MSALTSSDSATVGRFLEKILYGKDVDPQIKNALRWGSDVNDILSNEDVKKIFDREKFEADIAKQKSDAIKTKEGDGKDETGAAESAKLVSAVTLVGGDKVDAEKLVNDMEQSDLEFLTDAFNDACKLATSMVLPIDSSVSMPVLSKLLRHSNLGKTEGTETKSVLYWIDSEAMGEAMKNARRSPCPFDRATFDKLIQAMILMRATEDPDMSDPSALVLPEPHPSDVHLV